jgi:hypothetical protein
MLKVFIDEVAGLVFLLLKIRKIKNGMGKKSPKKKKKGLLSACFIAVFLSALNRKQHHKQHHDQYDRDQNPVHPRYVGCWWLRLRLKADSDLVCAEMR